MDKDYGAPKYQESGAARGSGYSGLGTLGMPGDVAVDRTHSAFIETNRLQHATHNLAERVHHVVNAIMGSVPEKAGTNGLNPSPNGLLDQWSVTSSNAANAAESAIAALERLENALPPH